MTYLISESDIYHLTPPPIESGHKNLCRFAVGDRNKTFEFQVKKFYRVYFIFSSHIKNHHFIRDSGKMPENIAS